MALGLCLAAYGAPATAPAQLPVPDRVQRAYALRQIEELRERNPLEYGPARLLELSKETSSSAAMRYAAAYRAMELAASSGRVPLALSALDYLSKTYDDELFRVRCHFLDALLESSARASAAVLAMRWAEEQYNAGQLTEVSSYMKVVEQARGTLSETLQQAAREYLDDYQYASSCPAPMLACIYRGQWKQNLPALAETDSPLAAAAKEDLAATDDLSRMKAADAWWSAGEKKGGVTGWRIAGRAIEIYRALPGSISGVERELIASRTAEYQRRTLRAQGYMPGVLRQIWRGDSGDKASAIVTDLELERDDPKLPLPTKDGHVLFRGALLVLTPGQYELNLTAGSAIRVTVDGEKRFEDPVVYRKRAGAKLPLEMSAGTHPFEVEVSSNSSKPRLHVEWITPGETEKRSIPQTSFFYDPLQQ